MENIAKTTHPLVLVAAVSVTVASLAAVAHFTGLLPGKTSEPPATVAANAMVPPPPAVAPLPEAAKPAAEPAPAAAPPAAEAVKPAAKPKHHAASSGPADRIAGESRSSSNRRVASGDGNDAGIDVIQSRPPQVTNQGPVAAPAAPPVCHECGTVEGVREVEKKGEGTGLGAVAGGVLGGVLGHQVGRGTGKDLATIAGAVGGAFGGHEIEKNVRSEKEYQVTVRFDDGTVRTFTQKSASGWRNGDRVRLDNGGLRGL